MKRPGVPRRSAPPRRAAPLQRGPGPSRRRSRPPLDPARREHVIARDVRDGGCVIAILAREGAIEGATACRSAQDGSPIDPRDRRHLTYEHVKPAAGMSAKAPDDPRWGAAACLWHNSTTVETSKYRDAIRDRLARLEAEGRL